MARQISEITRRDIREALEGVAWWGRLEEVEFLSRSRTLGVYVLPVRRGLNPYGFLGEVQGIQGQGKTVRVVADELFASLLRHQKTRERLLEVLLGQFEQSSSSQEAATNLALVERAGTLPRSLLRRLEEASSRNRHISGTQ